MTIRWHEDDHGTGITQMLELEPVREVQTPFQTIELFEHATFGRVLVLDGTVQLSQADDAVYHELAVHVPLLGRQRDSASVLIIGGGDGGILREALRHPFVRRVVMVEIDAEVIAVSSAEVGIQGDYADPRVELVTGDAAEWIERIAEPGGERFELIVIDATDSTSPSKVLWTDLFYSRIAACLAENGAVVDSDILIPGKAGPTMSRDPCEVGIFELIRTRRHFPSTECYYTKSPLYPGGYFVFFLYTKDGVSHAEPFRAHTGVHYNPELHRGAFALPAWWRRFLDGLR